MKTIMPPLITLAILILFTACNEEEMSIPDGTYSGQFTFIDDSEPKTGATTLELKNGKYTCSGNADRIPAGGSGTYSINTGKITFKDENFWTADFNWNLILNGDYYYTFDGVQLKISADKNDTGNYEYILEKK